MYTVFQAWAGSQAMFGNAHQAISTCNSIATHRVTFTLNTIKNLDIAFEQRIARQTAGVQL